MIKKWATYYFDYLGINNPKYLGLLTKIVGIELLMLISMVVLYEAAPDVMRLIALPYILIFVLFQLTLMRSPQAVTLNFFFLFLSKAFDIFKVLEVMPFSVSLVLLAISAISFVLHSGGSLFKREMPFILFVLTILASTYISPFDYGRESIRIFLGMAVSIVLAFRFVNSKAEIVLFVLFFIINQVISNGYLIYSYFSGGVQEAIVTQGAEVTGFRGSGLFDNSNETAVFIAVTLALLFWHVQSIKSKPRGKAIPYFLILAMLAAELLTGSRTGFVLASLLVFYLVVRSRNYILMIFGGLLFSIALLFFTSPELIVFERLNKLGEDESSTARYGALVDALDCTSKNPVLGVGLNNFSDWRSQNHGTGVNTHNTYLSISSEAGILGLILFLTFIFRPINLYFKKGKIFSKTRWGSLTHYLFASLILFYLAGLTAGFQASRIFYLLVAITGNALTVGLNNNKSSTPIAID